MKKFTLGVVTGAASLTLIVPLIAQIGSAQTGGSSSADIPDRPVPTQACTQAMAGLEEAHLAHFDEMMRKHKQALQERVDSLKAVAAITDDTQRGEAFRQMHEEMREGKALMGEDLPEDLSEAMEAVRTACGDRIGLHGPHGRFLKFAAHKKMGGPMMWMHGGPRGADASSSNIDSD